LWFRNNDGSLWRFIRYCIESGTFSHTTTNRIRLHVKAPPGHVNDPSGGWAPIQIGTYLHEGSATNDGLSGSDDNNWHFYHFANIPGDGLWWQVIIDTYPDHQRGSSGSTEHGNKEFVDTGSFNYFSMMNAFYWDYLQEVPYGDASQFASCTMFSETVADSVMRQIRTLAGTFDPATNTVKLGWNRRKDQPGHQYTIRWAHAPFVTFSGGTLVGTISAPNTADYNTVYTTFTNGALAGHQWVWVAIQPAGSSSFRQIAIDMELN
jgi:hypothetical protein